MNTKRDRATYFKEYYEKNKEKKLSQQKETGKKWREANADSIKEKSKEYYQKNKDKILERTSKNSKDRYWKDPQKALNKQKEWKTKNQEKYLLQGARNRAKRDNLPINITEEDIVIPEFCPYLNIKLEPFSGWSTPSLDKINPELGYIKGNIQVISVLANTMKGVATEEDLITFAINVLKLHVKDLEIDREAL